MVLTCPRPAQTAQEAVQWTTMGYPLPSRARMAPQCRSAASPPSSTGTSSVTWSGKITETDAQEDHRQLGHEVAYRALPAYQGYDAIFSGDPYWATWSTQASAMMARTLVTKRLLPSARHPDPRAPWWRAEHHHLLGSGAAGSLQRFCAKISIDLRQPFQSPM